MTKIYAHRGANKEATENTIEAFEKALNYGADGLELDIHFSKDGHLVVYHDFTLERLTTASGPVGNYTLEALQNISFKSGKATDKIPTLSAVFDLLKNYPKAHLNIELKAGSAMYPHIEEAVLKAVNDQYDLSKTLFSSFDHYALVKIKALDPKAQTGALTASLLYNPWEYCLKTGVDFYHPNTMTLNADMIQAFEKAHIGLNPYTVNDVNQASLFMKHNIHSIITDYPHEMIQHRQSLK